MDLVLKSSRKDARHFMSESVHESNEWIEEQNSMDYEKDERV
jgi:hypothetical protein